LSQPEFAFRFSENVSDCGYQINLAFFAKDLK